MQKLNITKIEELKILRRIVDLTSSELALKHVLDEVVQMVSDMTNADSVFIYLFSESNEELILKASKIPHDKELGKIVIQVGQGITGWVAKENKYVVIGEKAYKDKRFIAFDILPEDKYEAFLSIPINYKAKAIGVINIQHKASYTYEKSLINLMTTISKQVGGVIENTMLYEETKKKALQFDSLVKVSKTVTSEKYLQEILDLIVVVTAEMLNSKICSIMLVNDKELSIKATQSLSQEYKEKPNLKIDQSLSGRVVKEMKPKSVYDVKEEKEYVFRDLAEKEGLSSLLLVPMIVKNKAIGIVNVYTKDLHEFTKEEMDILQIIANQAASAIENTTLMEEVLDVKEALETRKLVERAKGLLMNMHGLTEDKAYKMIHKKSMDSSRPMKEIAQAIIIAVDMKI